MTGLVTAEALEVLVLVDNVTDSLSTTPSFITREWQVLRRQGMKVVAGGALCCANHGLSLVATVHGAGGTRTLLFDGGPVDYAVERNGTRLGVAFGAIDAAMLSHGHWDHAGGLPQALAMIRAANGGRAVPLHLHPGMFAERGSRQPDGGVLPMDRVPPPEAWAAMGAGPVLRSDPYTLLDGLFWISGEIPRRTGYERGLVNQVARMTEAEPWAPDPLLMDERALAVRVRGKGLVVFSACSHAGIVNVLQHVRDSFPGEPIHAVMGGFHLSGETEAIIPETVRDLAGFGLAHLFPAHCTGWRAVAALERAFGEPAVAPAAVGKLYRL
ncbi:MBL fold metallo-hydrolase [Paracraurococcus ruber]|uniref:MBL fold metallo-hydrolase n=1 Tax=Paracraurococcus ruber TaxID=77675 RepID=A0ABS1CWB1_9PROT|nr:MBL fold metallo-hydrolase [Paracraurococcus ruber]MBK1658591.1 MBL fold metallo-hydrolase [Paracraurococcus ruber]TDG28495.1 MBL fold metallo-hydrolase [Paracraurococcus ruber]